MPFLATMPMPMIAPINEMILSEVPVRMSAMSAPKSESKAPHTMATACLNEWNSSTSTRKTSKMAAASTPIRLRKEDCCCS